MTRGFESESSQERRTQDLPSKVQVHPNRYIGAGGHSCSSHCQFSCEKTAKMKLEIFLKSLLPMKEISAPLTRFYLQL